jgi:hypothetical protein
MDFPLPPQFPTWRQFPAGKIVTLPVQNWHFHRDPGSGGGNAGQDLNAPNGAVVVGIDYGVTSDHGAGAFDNHVVLDSSGLVNVPIGFHTGARLEPGPIWGAGATYEGGVTLKTVAMIDWLNAAFPHHFRFEDPMKEKPEPEHKPAHNAAENRLSAVYR